jgi:hypothetical protein
MKILNKVLQLLYKLENKFNDKFGWFFTNGNKKSTNESL